MKIIQSLAVLAALVVAGSAVSAVAAPAAGVKNIVLVHGGFVDGSGWEGVYDVLKHDGYTVTIVQNPTNSLGDDTMVTKRAIAAADGPVLLVGHSYGGAVVTEAGTDPKVAGVVYIAAFAPDKGESVTDLLKTLPKDAAQPPILPPVGGYLFLDKAKFAASFAADVKPELAAFMADAQVPWAVACLEGKITEPAWRVKPSWYFVSDDDKMIDPRLQRKMAERAKSVVTDAPGSHAIYVSKPDLVAKFIEQAATTVAAR